MSAAKLIPVLNNDYRAILRDLEQVYPDGIHVLACLKLLASHQYIPTESKFDVYISNVKSFVLIVQTVLGLPKKFLMGYWNDEDVSAEDLGQLILPFVLRNRDYYLQLCPEPLFEKFHCALSYLSQAGHDVGYVDHEDAPVYILSMEQPLHYVPELPEGYTMEKLNRKQANKLLSHWKYSEYDTKKNVAERLTLLSAYGVFYNIGNSKTLVAWTQEFGYGFVGMTFTLPKHRRKGLASIATMKLCQTIMEEGRTPIIEVDQENTKAFFFHKRMGFTIVTNGSYCIRSSS